MVCQNEVDIEALQSAGFNAILQPGAEDFGPMPKAGHYIIAANGMSGDIAKDLVGSGLCKPWQVSVSDLGGYQDLTHAAERGGADLIREIVRKSKSLFDDGGAPLRQRAQARERAELEHGVVVPASLCALGRVRVRRVRRSLRRRQVGTGSDVRLRLCRPCGPCARHAASICAWEDAGWRVRRNIERFAVSREGLIPMKGPTHRTNDLLQRVFRITCQPGGIRSIDWYLDRCEMLVHRENCRFFVFDPWNQHDEIRDKHDTETQYVNKMLRQLCEFVAVHKVIMIVVTHISAKSYDDEGGIRPFRIAQAHGSSHFGKMCDRGVCVARTRTLSGSNGEDRMIVRFDKAKDEESMGGLDNIALKFDREAMDIKLDEKCTEQIREAWRF